MKLDTASSKNKKSHVTMHLLQYYLCLWQNQCIETLTKSHRILLCLVVASYQVDTGPFFTKHKENYRNYQ